MHLNIIIRKGLSKFYKLVKVMSPITKERLNIY